MHLQAYARRLLSLRVAPIATRRLSLAIMAGRVYRSGVFIFNLSQTSLRLSRLILLLGVLQMVSPVYSSVTDSSSVVIQQLTHHNLLRTCFAGQTCYTVKAEAFPRDFCRQHPPVLVTGVCYRAAC
jgi:hypothetical protein